ncbi:MAG: hypothetical protein JWQ87_3574 [Candidatus Sulfotelmatobacter sp.]|nr:hypothetical protein [Candidatus Sulfotelmatobacter sp.]
MREPAFMWRMEVGPKSSEEEAQKETRKTKGLSNEKPCQNQYQNVYWTTAPRLPALKRCFLPSSARQR